MDRNEPAASAVGQDKISDREKTESLITRDRNSSGSPPTAPIQGQKPQSAGRQF